MQVYNNVCVCRYTYEDLVSELKSKLIAAANDACMYMKDERYSDTQMLHCILFYRYLNDVWLCNLDWSTRKFHKKGSCMVELLDGLDSGDMEDGEYRIMSTHETPTKGRNVHMPGYPE